MTVPSHYRHPIQGLIRRKIARPDPTVVARYRNLYSGFIADHLGKHSVMKGIAPIAPGMLLCGPAITSLGPDLTVRRMAINVAEPGDVLVVAAGGHSSIACFGDGTARRMTLKSVAGAVIDGATRDARFLREMRFPTFTAGITPQNFHYPEAGEHGSVNVPVICGGVLVHPGDLVFGDDDGVVVVPIGIVEKVIDEMEHNLEIERRQRAEFDSFTEFDVEEILRGRGYLFD